MDIVLVPGLWLTGSSWEKVVPTLEAAGHRAHAITLPGLESAAADRSGVTLDDQISAVVAAIDACDDKVLLVGHSAGCAIAYGAVDARPDRVARIIYVGGFPSPDGEAIAGGFTTDGADMPLPNWDSFDEADLVGVDDQIKALFLSHSAPSPANLTTDQIRLSDERRYNVPATAVCPEYTSEMLVGWMHEGHLDELARATNLELVDLHTGHWPQFTVPEELGRIIAARAFNPMVDEHGRVHPEGDLDEAGIALAFLEYQRATLAWKASGLDADQLNTKVGASSLTLGGLLKHMAWVEDYWFSVRLHAREASEPWKSADWKADEDWEFTSAADDSPDQLRLLWHTSVERARALIAAALADGGLETPAARVNRDGTALSLRWIVVHMIEEYARHNGHADLIREAVDGETGE